MICKQTVFAEGQAWRPLEVELLFFFRIAAKRLVVLRLSIFTPKVNKNLTPLLAVGEHERIVASSRLGLEDGRERSLPRS